MGNIALGKKPLESSIWKNVEAATDGNYTEYGANDGFAYAPNGSNFTLDFNDVRTISEIRVLFWDEHGGAQTSNDRKYSFRLKYSIDSITYHEIYSTLEGEEDRGWYIFTFPYRISARCIQVSSIHCTIKPNSHIVEIEIHDSPAPPLSAPRIKRKEFAVFTDNLKSLVERLIEEKAELLKDVKQDIEILQTTTSNAKRLLIDAGYVGTIKHFNEEANDNKDRSKIWILVSSLYLVILLSVLIWAVFCDNTRDWIIMRYGYSEETKEFVMPSLIIYYLGKVIFASLLIYIFTWLLKNYRAERHNYTVNTHKAMSLNVATSILSQTEFSGDARNEIYSKAAEMAFSHQSTGFFKDESDGSSPNVIQMIKEIKP